MKNLYVAHCKNSKYYQVDWSNFCQIILLNLLKETISYPVTFQCRYRDDFRHRIIFEVDYHSSHQLFSLITTRKKTTLYFFYLVFKWRFLQCRLWQSLTGMSHRSQIPMLINNISDYTVCTSCNILWFIGLMYFNCDRQLCREEAPWQRVCVTWGDSKNSVRKCCLLIQWSVWWYNTFMFKCLHFRSKMDFWSSAQWPKITFDTTFSLAWFIVCRLYPNVEALIKILH